MAGASFSDGFNDPWKAVAELSDGLVASAAELSVLRGVVSVNARLLEVLLSLLSELPESPPAVAELPPGLGLAAAAS